MKKPTLFDVDESWKEEWVGMPEFVQEQVKEPYAKIIVTLDTKEDLEFFSKIINQKLTKKTKSIRYPQVERGIHANKLYINES
jgi:spore coat polysaccharide biosynthesis protein SpsF (cytidylyltransferase family)